MRWTHRQAWIATVGLGAVAAVIATGVLDDTSPPDTGPAGSGVVTALDPPGGEHTATGSHARTVITLGALDPPPTMQRGASFDPCTVIGWADLPATVRPARETPPTPQPPAAGEEFQLGCRFDNSSPTAVFTLTLTWGTTPPLPLTPSSSPGASPAVLGGRAGLQRPGTDPAGHPSCTALMPVTGGVAGATVINTRFPHTDPCAVAATALTVIATHVP